MPTSSRGRPHQQPGGFPKLRSSNVEGKYSPQNTLGHTVIQVRGLSNGAGSAVTHLCTDWVDTDGAVQLLLGQSTLECGCKALRHLSSVWTQYMEAHDTFLRCKINRGTWVSWSLPSLPTALVLPQTVLRSP